MGGMLVDQHQRIPVLGHDVIFENLGSRHAKRKLLGLGSAGGNRLEPGARRIELASVFRLLW